MRWPYLLPRLLLLLLFAAMALFVCRGPHRYTTDPSTDAWLVGHRGDYERAIRRAGAWLEPLSVDPAELRAHGIKGKKKLVELIDAWGRLYQVAEGGRAQADILARIDLLAEVTRTDAYHDMLEIDDVSFKQDATSYLRAAYLLDGLGLDIERYRAGIAEAEPRLDAHMPQRGPFQQYGFHVYYAHFGLEEPFPLASALEDGLIARRAPAETMDRYDAYAVTHEIFMPYDYGDDLEATPFTVDDLRYLRVVLPQLVDVWMARQDPDLVAELVSCLRFIRAVDLPAYTEGLAFLLRTQHPDGHWGDYRAEAERIGAWATTYKLELHTTTVAIDALTVAFHPAWNRSLAPVVPP
jgi:hypothetical protein